MNRQTPAKPGLGAGGDSVPVGTRYRWGLGTGGDSVPVGTRYRWGLPGLQDLARTTRLCQDYKSLPGLQDFARGVGFARRVGFARVGWLCQGMLYWVGGESA